MLSRATAPFAMTHIVFELIANAPIRSLDGTAKHAPRDGGFPLADHQHCAVACRQVFVAAPEAIATPAPLIVAHSVDWTALSSPTRG